MALEDLEALKLQDDSESDTLTCECATDEEEILAADLDSTWEL